jgi:uncharacterized protein (DUF302 family)
MKLDYTVATAKPFDEAVDAVVAATADAGFKVQFVHDVSATLAEKGFERERVTIVVMLPCPIMIYAEGRKVFISTMRPTLIGGFFPEAGIGEVAAEVERILEGVIDTAAA